MTAFDEFLQPRVRQMPFRTASVTDALAARRPAAVSELHEALRCPRYHLGSSVGQAGLRIALLERILEGLRLDDWPGVPESAVRQRQLTFLAGRLCAEHALQLCGVEDAGPIGRGMSGEPLWPSGWTGSISHTSHQAFAVAACRNGCVGIGIDAEEVVDDRAVNDILQVCVHRNEMHLVTARPDVARLVATVLFSAKEAYYKAVHSKVQRFVDFDEVFLSELSLESGCFQIKPSRPSNAIDGLPAASGRFVVESDVVLTYVSPESVFDARTQEGAIA